jgi:hypothetical protein
MIRRVPPALRRSMGTLLILAVSYLILEAPALLGGWLNPAPPGPPPGRPGRILLIVASAGCGMRRVMGFHPIYDNAYKRWLELTPWTSRKPLPLGPIALTWGDGLYMATVILLSSTQPEPRSMQLLCIFLLSHLLALLPTLWTGSWAIGYTTAAGLGLAVRFFNAPAACLATATLVYLLAYEGLRRSLGRFPWTPRLPQPSADNVLADPVVAQLAQIGWPYGQMLGEVRDARPLSRPDALLGCMLLSWWIDCIAALFPEPRQQFGYFGIVSMVIIAVPIIRLVIYVRGYAPPLTLWARIRLFKLILPGYDRIFVGPVCSLLAGPMTLALLTSLGVPFDIGYSVALGMMVLVALLTPPSLRRWRLTGGHRMVSTISQASSLYVRVG